MKLGKGKSVFMGIMLAAAISAGLCAPAGAFEELYESELTGEWIPAQLKDQRPVAVMVDNESIALPHFGTSAGDVVYELMNSTANGRITRLMVLMKDWGSITQLGSIRSVRSSNIPLAGEWNAVLVHDGGPFYVDEYFAKPYASQHLSGGFSRVNNGKPVEFTEYVMTGEIGSRLAAAGYPATYNEFRNPDVTHFNFVPDGQTVSLTATYGEGARLITQVSLPF